LSCQVSAEHFQQPQIALHHGPVERVPPSICIFVLMPLGTMSDFCAVKPVGACLVKLRGHRGSSVPKTPLRIHFLFMRATVGQDAQSWLPDNNMEGWICLSPLSKLRSAPRTLRRWPPRLKSL